MAELVRDAETLASSWVSIVDADYGSVGVRRTRVPRGSPEGAVQNKHADVSELAMGYRLVNLGLR